MRIAQVAPLHEAVPPKLYGGTERVVSYLTEELVARGHEVTLFASGDSRTSAHLVAVCESALRLSKVQNSTVWHLVMLEALYRRAADFDIIHFHCDHLHYSWARRSPVPTLTTLHGRQDLPDLVPLYREFHDIPLASISDDQRRPLPWLNWRGTVHHGLPKNFLKQGDGGGGYLAFLGRLSPEKRVDRAIEICRRTGIPLKIAAKCDPADQDYFATVVRPLLTHPLVEWIGEIGEAEKQDFLGNALALLFPIDWPEPFGLVMIEAMACGTPTIAWLNGSVPEVLDQGISGFLVTSVEQAAAAVGRCREFDRSRCRALFEQRYSASRMAADYLALYRELSLLGTVCPAVVKHELRDAP